MEVYKESITEKITKKTTRIKYSKKTSCDCPKFAGKTDRHFLIMGKDVGLQGSSNVMGHNVFVKEWPMNDPANFFKKLVRLLGKDGC